MNKQFLNEKWTEIFENYYCGMSQRELEKKYGMDTRTIQRYCKFLMINLLTNPSSVIRKNWVKIQKEIKEIIENENDNCQ